MMRFHLLILLAFISLRLGAQTVSNGVTDIVVVFKMHVDIGYTDWAEGVLQKYDDTMLDETLAAIDETSSLPEAEQFVWTIPAWPLK